MPKKKGERAVETLAKRMGLSKVKARKRLELLALRHLCTLDEAAARVIAADRLFAEIEARSQRSRRARRHPSTELGGPD